MSHVNSSGASSWDNTGQGQRIKIEGDNWSGKTDSAERRRIQNRINQRAHRQRQRSLSSASPGEPDEDPGAYSDEGTRAQLPNVPNVSCGHTMAAAPAPGNDAATDEPDELARTINANITRAVLANAQQLGIEPSAVRHGSLIVTPREAPVANVPQALVPIVLQQQVPHDAFIDAIPHPRFRFNVLRAIAARQIDASALSACLRRSGAVFAVHGQRRRDGLVVWRNATDIRGWELSELFVMVWGRLLEGCEDWLEVTNAWRRQRCELPLTVARGSG